jgi:predicted transcriptional regulator
MIGKAKKRVSIGLSPACRRELSAVAIKAGVSESWIGERAITEFLERHRSGEVQLFLGLNDNQRGKA